MPNGTTVKAASVDHDAVYRHAFDAAQKFNDRTLQVIFWIGRMLVLVFTVLVGLSAYNLNSEKDRIERTLTTLEERFTRLSSELKGTRFESPLIEVLSLKDKAPIGKEGLFAEIYRDESLPDKPYNISLRYSLRNVGKGSTGRIWTNIYFESKTLFNGLNDTDEIGYGTQALSPYTSWTGDFTATGGDFPGAGFSTNISYNIKILEDKIPKGKYKVLLKIYYGWPETRVERIETHFELLIDWVRPKS